MPKQHARSFHANMAPPLGIVPRQLVADMTGREANRTTDMSAVASAKVEGEAPGVH